METERFIIKVDEENEQFKILDSKSLVGTEDEEDKDMEWVATTYTMMYAMLIRDSLNRVL